MSAKKTEQKQEPKFSKSQILKARIFADKVDVLNAILSDSDTLTITEVSTRIDDFMKGKVK